MFARRFDGEIVPGSPEESLLATLMFQEELRRMSEVQILAEAALGSSEGTAKHFQELLHHTFPFMSKTAQKDRMKSVLDKELGKALVLSPAGTMMEARKLRSKQVQDALAAEREKAKYGLL